MKEILIVFVIVLSPMAYSGEINDVFGGGIFDTKWGQKIEAIKESHPKGKRKNYGNIVHLEVKDDRNVLGVERREKDKIVFGFDSEGRLSSAGVYYKSDTFGDLLSKLDTLFGSHTNKDSSYGVITEWPIDEGVKISLSFISFGLNSDVIFTVEYQALDKPTKSKKELGF